MDDKEKSALEKMLKKIKRDLLLYGSQNTKLSAKDLAILAENREFENLTKFYNLTKHEGEIILTYFRKYEQYQYTNDLYKNFPHLLNGERKKSFGYEEDIEKLDKNIPLID